MNTTKLRQWVPKGALVGVLGIAGLLLSGGAAPAQDVLKNRTLIRSGYTRPGSPPDREVNGKIVPIHFDDTNKLQPKKIMGGTVYFAVYERIGTEGDVWGTGQTGFDDAFMQGRNFKGKFSPNLDTKAKYLYLYQLVNDRGLDPSPTGIRTAAMLTALEEKPSQPLLSTSVRLLVDPRYITSWGHFQHNSFASVVSDRKLNGPVAEAALGGDGKKTRIVFSANPSILAEVPYKQYLDRAPANPLGDLRNGFGVSLDTVGLKTAAATKDLEAEKEKLGVKVKFAAWKENMLQASKSAKEPAFVQLLYPTNEAGQPVAVGQLPGGQMLGGQMVGGQMAGGLLAEDARGVAQAYFRVDWQGDQILQMGHHSMIFGFTTDLPPIDEEVRLYDQEAAQGGAIKMMAFAEGNQPGAVPGTGPSPMPMAPMAAPPVGGGATGLLGGQGGGGFGMPGGFAAGDLGGGRLPILGGGGVGGGSGGGTPSNSNGTTPSNGSTTGNNSNSTGTNTGTPQTQAINFAPVLINSQQQAQQQQQQQKQKQKDSQSDTQSEAQQSTPSTSQFSTPTTPTTPVVPAPAAVWLGLLGLPALLFLRRRKAVVANAT